MSERADTRSRIVAEAAYLLREQGPAAVTTRGVAERAGVQPPTIYRLFGDKEGLLEAVVEHVMAEYVSAKAATVDKAAANDVDPVEELRTGWRAQVEFSVANPAIYRLVSDPDRVMHSPAAASGRQVLETRVRRVAAAGRLRVDEQRAVDMIFAAGNGTVQTLLATAPERRDPRLTEAMLAAVLGQILTDPVPAASNGPVQAAITLRAVAGELDALSAAERALLAEWLERLITSRSSPGERE